MVAVRSHRGTPLVGAAVFGRGCEREDALTLADIGGLRAAPQTQVPQRVHEVPVAVAPRGAWRSLRNCVGVPLDVMVPSNGLRVEKARVAHAACGPCPVQAECFAEANEHGHVGVWGDHYRPDADIRWENLGARLDRLERANDDLHERIRAAVELVRDGMRIAEAAAQMSVSYEGVRMAAKAAGVRSAHALNREGSHARAQAVRPLVLELVALGCTYEQAGKLCGVSKNTVNSYVRNWRMSRASRRAQPTAP